MRRHLATHTHTTNNKSVRFISFVRAIVSGAAAAAATGGGARACVVILKFMRELMSMCVCVRLMNEKMQCIRAVVSIAKIELL